MKKLLPTLLAIILTVIIFTGCKPIFPDEYNDFDYRDTILISVNEKLYESQNEWIQLDSITYCTPYEDYYAWFTCFIHDSLFEMHILQNRSEEKYFDNYTYFFGIRFLNLQPSEVMDSIQLSEYAVRCIPTAGVPAIEVDKPNIYLYPTRKTRMTVSLELPEGGKVTKSIPEYPKKWKNIRVKPDGTINRKYDFLFYEADIPGDWQYDKGWSVAQKDLKFFFEMNLRDHGFNKKEIKDFTDWWIPRLKDHPFYEIYPQHTAKVESIVPLKINKDFDSLLRLFYFVEGVDVKRELPEPVIPKFEREGFVVTEWGVSVR